MNFKETLYSTNRPLIGSFIKTTNTSQPIEILATVGLDYVVIDAEHAPFDQKAIEIAILAAKASGIIPLVRVAELSNSLIQYALDNGAAGIITPHIDSVEKAQKLVAATKYAKGRGFSNSTRAGKFGASKMWDQISDSDAKVLSIAMIEDVKGVEQAEQILAVEGLDAIFIGRADLCVALNEQTADSEKIAAITAKIIDMAKVHNKAVLLFSNDMAEVKTYFDSGVKAFVVHSDQSFLRIGAIQTLNQIRKIFGE